MRARRFAIGEGKKGKVSERRLKRAFLAYGRTAWAIPHMPILD
jgi:hypothetical protein